MNTLAKESNFATMIIINNPFDVKDHERKSVVIDKSPTIKDLIPETYAEYIVSLNGSIIEEENWGECFLSAEDYLVVSPVPQGGGGDNGKTILRVAAMIALTYFTVGAGAGALFAAEGAGAVAGMLTFAAGSALINNLIPIEPNVPKTDGDLESSTSYGIDGPKNTAKEGVVVPVVYGTYRVAGNMVNMFVRNTNDQTQDLFMQMVVSEGPIGGVSETSILINDQKIEDFDSYEVDQGYGGLTQGTSNWFGDTINPVSVGVTLTDEYISRTTSVPVDKFRIDVVAPGGLRHIKKSGESRPLKIDLNIEYRLQGSTPWLGLNETHQVTEYEIQYVFTHKFFANLIVVKLDSAIYRTIPRTDDIDASIGSDGILRATRRYRPQGKDQSYINETIVVGYVKKVPQYNSSPVVFGLHRTSYRTSFESSTLPQGVYEIRIKRETAQSDNDKTIDELTWTDLNEILDEDIGLIGTAWLGIKIRLDDQLNGIPKVTGVATGKVIKSYNYDEETTNVVSFESSSSNPAWIAYDMMTNKRYGGNIPESRIDLDRWILWADYCDVQGLEFNGVFDNDMDIWGALQTVFRVGHAQIINIGTRYSVAIERASVPTMMFNVANIIEKTFSMSWLPISDRANEIEVTYFDEEDEYLPHTLRVSDAEVPGSASKRRAQLKLYGVTKEDVALKEAQLMLNLNKYTLTTVTFDAPVESIACTIGDLILVQHDIPQWGFGGRLTQDASSATSGIYLDKDFDVEVGKTYELLLTHDALLRSTQTVSAVISNRYVRLNETLPTDKIARAVISGEEYTVVGQFTDTLGEGVYIDRDISGAVVGSSCQLYDTDVIESRQFTSVTLGGAGTYNTLSVDTAFSGIASKLTKFMVGELGKSKKPFRVTGISGGSDFTRTITALEYNDSIYSDSGAAVTAPNYSSLPQGIAHVSNIQIFQETQVIGGVYRPIIIVTWTKPDDDRYAGADVSVREENGQWRFAGSASGGATQIDYNEATLDQILEFRVVARDSLGTMAPASSAPVGSITIQATGPAIDPPTNVEVKASWLIVELTWTNPKVNTYATTIIYRGTVDNFADVSVVEIHNETGEKFADTSIIAGTQYYYWIRSVNSDGIESELSSVSGLTLPAPSIPVGLTLTNGFTAEKADIEWADQADAYRYGVEVVMNSTTRRIAELARANYSYGIDEMAADGYIDRNIRFNVSAKNIMGMESVAATLDVSNAAPSLPSSISVVPGFQVLFVSYIIPTDHDYTETRIWVSETQGFTPSNSNLVARAYGGPLAVTDLQTNTTYYLRIATFDTFGQGQMSAEWVAITENSQIAGLSPWATVNQVDRDFIAANIDDDSIESTKIEKLTASKIVAGTIAVTEAISVEGVIESVVGPYNVSMGPVPLDGKTALFSFTAGGAPVLALFEDGTATYSGALTITAGSTGYGSFTDRPTSLAEINGSEGTKLGNIPADADATNYTDGRIANSALDAAIQAAQNAGATAQQISDIQAAADAGATISQISSILNDAAVDATAKADAAETAATNAAASYTVAQANLAETQAKAYADGIVTDEEARAIADATAKANAAQTAATNAAASDATAKANAAQASAISSAAADATAKRVIAEAYADGIVDDEEARAIADATAKANAAQAAAISAASADATSKASAAQAAAIASAAADATAKRVIAEAYADGIVDDEEARAIADATAKANAARVAAEATAAADATAKANAAALTSTWSGVSSKPAFAPSNATYGATWEVNLTPPIRFRNGNPTVSGLFHSATHMGYWNSSTGWKTYMANNGDMFLGGSGQGGNGGYLTWDSSSNTLTVRGDIYATSVSASAIDATHINGLSITGLTIAGTTITGGTVTADEVRTSASGERTLLDGATNTLQSWWDDGSSGGFRAHVKIGNITANADAPAIVVGDDAPYDGTGILVRTKDSVRSSVLSVHYGTATVSECPALYGISPNGTGTIGHGIVGVAGKSDSSGLAFNAHVGGYGNFKGVQACLIKKTNVSLVGSQSGMKGRAVKIVGILEEYSDNYLFDVELDQTDASDDCLGVIQKVMTFDLKYNTTLYGHFLGSAHPDYAGLYDICLVYTSGVAPARVNTSDNTAAGNFIKVDGGRNGEFRLSTSTSNSVVGKNLQVASGAANSGTLIPVLLGI